MIELYLHGENKSKLNNLFKRAESLKKFRIDFSPKAISNCPICCYFESHLVFNGLQSLSSHPVISIIEEFTDYPKSGITCYARVVDKELADKFAERDNLPFLKSSSVIEKDINDGYECGWYGMRDETTIAIKLISVSDEMAEYFNERQRERLMKFNTYVCFSRFYSIATLIADYQEKIINYYPILPLEGLYGSALFGEAQRAD